MRTQVMSSNVVARSAGVGIAIAILLSVVMVPAFLSGLSPLPKPLGLAFAQTLLGPVPLPVGLLFHLIYVTAVTTAFLTRVARQPSFAMALGFGLLLWVVVLLVFFPVVGWGFFGLDVGPHLMIASLVPHVLYGVLLWLLPKRAFQGDTD